MGKKKKGGGAEKTAAKTDKKIAQKMKKTLALAGEDEIESIVAEIEREEAKKMQVIEKTISTPPRPRAFFSLVSHPEKDELILFGGEFYNGKETEVYKELFVYKILKDEWRLIKSPGGPAPRSGHQSVSVPLNKGEMWVFGGEYTTKSESQFYHYKDLWKLSLVDFKWEKITSPGCPSSRSGHRMVYMKRKLILFGGYHDNLVNYQYYNDLHLFDLDTRTWMKLAPSGVGPSPRSACQMVTTPEGKILIWGGYSKIKTNNEIEKGVVYEDMFLLTLVTKDSSEPKWKWSSIKPGGIRPEAMSGISVTTWSGRAFTFGGALDTETDDDEDIQTQMCNKMYSLDLTKFIWSPVILSGKKDVRPKRRRKAKVDDVEMEVEETNDAEPVPSGEMETQETVTSMDEDGVFTLKVGGAIGGTGDSPGESSQVDLVGTSNNHPHPRINAGLVTKSSLLYLYGGIFEDGPVVHTLSDLYSIDLQRADEWRTILPCELSNQAWCQSETSSESSEEDSEASMSNDE